MRNTSPLLALVFFAICLFTSCNLNEDQILDVSQTIFNIPDDLEEWLLPFDSVGQNIVYRNANNAIDSTVSVVVERTFTRTAQNFIECNVDDRQGDCEFNSINIAFPEGISANNFQGFVSIFSIAPNDLQVMTNRTGFGATFAQLNIDTEEIVSGLPDNYTSTFQANFNHNGTINPAIITENITLDNVPAGAIIAPKRMILVRGIGVVEWDDFNGNTWVLED